MEQHAASPQKKPNGIERFAGVFLKFCSWMWGLTAIGGGMMNMSARPFLASLHLLLGLLMLPPVRRLLWRLVGFRPPHPVAPLAIGAAIFAVAMAVGSSLQAEQKAEQRRLAQIAEVQEQEENAFIASYPYVDRDALRAWRSSAADSTSDSNKTLASFLVWQQDLHNQRIADSIDTIRRLREDSILAAKQRRKDSIDEVREAHRLLALEQQRKKVYEQEQAPEMYNGHVVYTGRRGGRYYINSNGNKTYIP